MSCLHLKIDCSMNNNDNIKKGSMNYVEFLAVEAKLWIAIHGRDLLDAASGSFLYFMYGVTYKKQDYKKGLIGFLIGTVFAMYVSPQVIEVVTWANHNFVVWMTGLMAMRLTQVALELDLKAIANQLIAKYLK
jgi:hypothetical protein